MSFTETLRLLVEADTKGAVGNVEKLGKTTERETSKSKDNLDKWGNGLTKAGAGMVTFGAIAVAGLGAAAMASEEAHLSEVKLENTLANMPKLAGENKKQFMDLADAIQDKTAADGDAVVAGEAMLGTFSMTADEITGLMPLVVDYARKFGIDIPQAATMVGKAVDGSVGALKRNGVSIDEVMFKTDRYGAVQKALAEQVGGFAEEEGKTFAGSLERMKNQMGDVVEGVGVGAVEAFTSMGGVVEAVTDKFTEMSPATQSLIGKIGTFGSVGLIAAGGLSMVVGQAIKMRANLGTAVDAGRSAIDMMGGLKGAAALAAGVAGIAGLAVAIDSVSGGATAVEVDLDKLATALDDTTRAGKEAVQQDIEKAQSMGALDTLVTKVADSNFTLAESMVDAAEAGGVHGEELKQLRDIIASKKDEDIKGAAASQEHAEAIDEATGAMEEEESATEQAEDALKNYMDTLRGTFDPLFAMSDALRGNQEAHADLNTKQMIAAATQDDYNDAVRRYGEDSKTAREAAAANMDAQADLTDAQRKAQDAVVDLQGASATLKNEMDNGGLTAEKARQQFINMATTMGYTQAEAEGLASDFGFVTSQAQVLGRQKPTPHVAVTGDDAARARLRMTRDAVNDIPGSKNISITARMIFGPGIDLVRALGGFGGHAAGGPMRPGEISWVGEDGPELYQAGPQGGHVYNQAQLRSGASGGGMGPGGETHIHNYYINGSLLSERALTRDQRRLTRKGRGAT